MFLLTLLPGCGELPGRGWKLPGAPERGSGGSRGWSRDRGLRHGPHGRLVDRRRYSWTFAFRAEARIG